MATTMLAVDTAAASPATNASGGDGDGNGIGCDPVDHSRSGSGSNSYPNSGHNDERTPETCVIAPGTNRRCPKMDCCAGDHLITCCPCVDDRPQHAAHAVPPLIIISSSNSVRTQPGPHFTRSVAVESRGISSRKSSRHLTPNPHVRSVPDVGDWRL